MNGIFLHLILALLLSFPATRELRLRSISDMTVAPAANGQFTLYIADAQTGGIFAADTNGDSPIALDGFHLRFSSPQYSHPVAIAYEGGMLFGCDAISGVFSLNLATNTAEPIPISVEKPVSISVSNGKLAVTDGVTNEIYFYSVQSHESKTIIIPTIKHIGRVVIWDRQLLALDRDPGSIISFALPDSSASPDESPAITQLRTEGEIEDFWIQDGIYYLKHKDYVAVLETMPSAAQPLIVLHNNAPMQPGDAISFAGNRMFVGRLKAGRVDALPVQVPVRLAIKSDAATSNATLIALYSYLTSRGLLPAQRIPAPATQKRRLSAWLLERKVLIPPLAEDSLSDKSISDLHTVLCSLNRSLCGKETLELSKPFSGTALQLPAINLKSFLSTAVKPLRGESLADYISKNISAELAKKARLRFKTPERVGDLDPGDLEQFLAYKGFHLLAVPTANYQPGQIIDSITGTIIGCPTTATYAISAEPFYIPNSVSIGTSGINPFKISPAIGVVKSAEVSVGQAVVETLSNDAISSIMTETPCAEALSWRHAEILSQSIKVIGLRYKFFNRDKALLQVPPESIASFGSAAVVDPEREWSVSINKPLYIAYKTTKLVNRDVANNQANAQDNDSVSSSSLFGLFVLPSEIWESRFLAVKTDIDNGQSELMQLSNPQDDITIVPTASPLKPTPSSIITTSHAAVLDTTPSVDEVARARQDLLSAIHYDASLIPVNMSEVQIGVGEHLDSFDSDHTAFWDAKGESALWKIDMNGTLSHYKRATPPPPPPPVSPEMFRGFNEDQDHGTHIAGMLAARSGKIGLGLIPSAQLVMMDTAKLGDLPTLIDRAVTAGVRIFNLSFAQSLDTKDSIYMALRSRIEKSTAALFVVAAGNDMNDVSTKDIPVGFKFDNVIGIAASEGFHKLDQWIDGNDRVHIGSNYGTSFVQLLAPGRQIYSSAHNNGYAAASGSSQAVPQVVAAAAVLYQETGQTGIRLKYRLMYTADWLENFRGSVWGGGLLNFRRATWEPLRNLWRGQSDPDTTYAFKLSGTSTVAINRGASFDTADGATVGDVPPLLMFNGILRISTQPDKKLRVIYQDQGQLRVLKDVVFTEGKIQCTELQVWNGKEFVMPTQDFCAQGIDVRQVFDYVATMKSVARS